MGKGNGAIVRIVKQVPFDVIQSSLINANYSKKSLQLWVFYYNKNYREWITPFRPFTLFWGLLGSWWKMVYCRIIKWLQYVCSDISRCNNSSKTKQGQQARIVLKCIKQDVTYLIKCQSKKVCYSESILGGFSRS